MELTVTTGDWIVYRLLKEHSTIRSSNTNIRGMLTHWKSELRCFKNNLQNISARSEMFLVEGKVRPPRPVNQHRQIPKSKTSCCHRCYTPHVCPPYACSQNFARRSIWVVNIWLHINWIFSVQVEPPEKITTLPLRSRLSEQRLDISHEAPQHLLHVERTGRMTNTCVFTLN